MSLMNFSMESGSGENKSGTQQWDGESSTFPLHKARFQAWIDGLGETFGAVFRGEGMFSEFKCDPSFSELDHRARLIKEASQVTGGGKTVSGADKKTGHTGDDCSREGLQAKFNMASRKIHNGLVQTLKDNPLKRLISSDCMPGDGPGAWKNLNDICQATNANNKRRHFGHRR